MSRLGKAGHDREEIYDHRERFHALCRMRRILLGEKYMNGCFEARDCVEPADVRVGKLNEDRENLATSFTGTVPRCTGARGIDADAWVNPGSRV
jgi:hypothetical protein